MSDWAWKQEIGVAWHLCADEENDVYCAFNPNKVMYITKSKEGTGVLHFDNGDTYDTSVEMGKLVDGMRTK
jgi:hypothetical protein